MGFLLSVAKLKSHSVFKCENYGHKVSLNVKKCEKCGHLIKNVQSLKIVKFIKIPGIFINSKNSTLSIKSYPD